MRSKRLLACLLALCLVLGNLAPMASAVEVPEDSVIGAQHNAEKTGDADNAESSPSDNSLIVSPDGAAQRVPTLRDNPVVKSEIETAESGKGNWQVTPVDAPNTSLLSADVPECIGELRAVAELYSANEVVSAFVVMEDQPLAETHSSPRLVSAAAEKALIEKQDAVINAIEKSVTNGEKLEVRYQFTYLTNSFSVKTEFKNLEKIAYIPGVKSVFVMPVYTPCTTSNPNTAASGAMTGVHTVWEDLGYTGTGMKIAIIDTGLDLDHPSFAADPELGESSMTAADIEAVLQDLNAYAVGQSVTANDLYRSAKVPYAFNYVDASLNADHSRDTQGDHGTHVAGIAAANAVEGTPVVGMAPDAQIIVMKVFGANGGAYADDIVAALEDAMTLGCDVVNASLGSPNGFASSETELDLIYQRLASQNIVATFSAGNEGTSSYMNMWGTDMNRTQNPDNATVGSPATWANTLAIASAENCEVQTPFFALADGTKVFFNNDTYANYYGNTPGMEILIGEETEYVFIDGLGKREDYYDAEGNSLVSGKIAVVRRGVESFFDKIYNAEIAGAVACIVANNTDAEDPFTILMSNFTTDEYGDPIFPSIPSCMISMADGDAMAAAESKTLTVSESTAARVVEGGQMSSFSSWGVSPDLQLVPDITGIGGNVYSCYDGGNYGLMSGTSMSAPQLAGITALVMQHLYTIYPNVPDGTIRDLAEAILMSTAEPIIGTESGVEASPRQQGAGLVNAYKATTTTTYLTVGGGRPKAELGDNANGVYKFTFEIHNIGDEAKTYTLDASLLTEAFASAYGEYFMYGMDMALDGSVTFDKDKVTVPAGGRANVAVTITLSDYDKYVFDVVYENGGYVEGYVYLFNEEGAAELSLPFLGFYGDWTDAPVFDSAFWYDNTFFSAPSATGLPEGDEYYHVLWTDLGGEDWVLGMNPYSGPAMGTDGKIIYDPANNVVSPNGDGVLDGISDIYLSLLRNAKTLTFTYTVDGEVVHQETILNNGKTMYLSNYGQVVPWIYSRYGSGMYDFTAADGSVLPNGTEVLLTIDATVDYGNGGEHTMSFPIIVDNQKPELLQVIEVPNETEDGTQYLIGAVVSDDISLASVVLMSASGTTIYDQAYDYDLTDLGDGTYLVAFDVTDLGTEFTIVVCDYACNEAYYKVTYESAPDGNLPEMDTTQLYAYRVLDDHIYSDHMYGWVSMNKPESADDYANISVWTDDYLEYAAINAAEFVGGKIYAVDAVYNLVVMDPGLFDRKPVTNLGVNVIDMTFDDSTDTMYVLSKQGNYTYLYSMDLLTGDLTQLKYYGYYNSAPWAIADDDNGTLYAIKYNSANIFTLDVAGGTYAMTAVTDADGANVVITDSDGANVKPSAYAQSITWIDGVLYWAYLYSPYSYFYSTDLICIDTEDWTHFAVPYAAQAYDSTNALVDYYPETELVGLLSLVPTDYEIPEATEVTEISLDAAQIILNVGQAQALSASWLPWNYDLDESQLVWTSDDETVATVADGVVTGVGEGSTKVTVSYGDLTASCEIIVVEISGHFEAYNYFSADDHYGYMIDVDLETMDYYLIGDRTPADFLAGDYNGHDGYFYGYTEGGQFWRYDIESGECVALGTAIGAAPADMAYDYSTGFMYAVTLDYYSGMSTICAVNMTNGELVPLADALLLMTLACDAEGNLYSITAEGNLYKMTFGENGMETETLMSGLGTLQYMQSMCYSYENDVLIWANPESANVYWIGHNNEEPYAIALGDPTDSGLFEFVGMFEIPAEIPALPEFAVENLTAEDMILIKGSTMQPKYSVEPLNATCQTVTWTSSDESIVKVNADGSLTGVADGTAVISGVLNDTVGGKTHEVSINVTVMTAADNMYGHVLSDMATMGGYFWTELDPSDTATYTYLGETTYTIYAEEYYDGKLYAYGYDGNDWEANWQMFVMDPETYEILEQHDAGEGFPFVYDMTYDYNTSTMYAVAGVGSTATDIYIVNTNTGALLPFLATEQFFMSLAAGPDGKLYAMEQSGMEMNWETWMIDYAPTKLYSIDSVTKEIELVGSTGVKSNMLASMSYDYDTDKLYWTSFFQDQMMGTMSSGLCIVDPETAQAIDLGMIGTSGAQVSGLYILCDEFPEEVDQLNNVILTPTSTMISVGATTTVDAMTLPMSLDAEVVWTTSDASVATVADGVVTGVSQGAAVITASVTYNGVTKTATCNVVVLNADAGFLTYNVTDGGWATISRHDQTVVTNLTEGEDETEVNAVVSIGADVYGVDVENNFFKLDTETYERTVIGTMSVELDVENGYDSFEVVDLDYDVANDRLLALGNMYSASEGEMYYGRSIYEVNLEDGSLTELHNFGYDYYIMAMAVGADGTVYYYSCYDDMTYTLDLESGSYQALVNLQTQALYGDYDSDQSMYYDILTDTIYMVVTGNGNYYRMVTIDPVLGTLTLLGNVGEVVSYAGDYFAGLTFVEEPVPAPDAEYVGVSLSLAGDIGLNFYYNLSEKILADEGAYILFTYEDGTVTTVPLTEAYINDGMYRYSAMFAAKEMGVKVTAQVFSTNGAACEPVTMSIQDYAVKAFATDNEKLIVLMKAMLNYGAAAQVEFAYDAENLVNSILTEEDRQLTSADASEYAQIVSGTEEGLSYYGASLILDSETSIRIYFTLAGGKTIEDYTFTIDGETVEPIANGSRYYIVLSDIAAKDLEEWHTFCMGGVTVEYAGLSYVARVQEVASTDTDLMNLATALYAYNQAANDFFAEN